MVLASTTKKDGHPIPLTEIVLIIHFRNQFEVLLTSGRVRVIRNTLTEARKRFSEANIRFFEPCSSTLVVYSHIARISTENKLQLSPEIPARAPSDFIEKIESIIVSRRRRKLFARMREEDEGQKKAADSANDVVQSCPKEKLTIHYILMAMAEG